MTSESPALATHPRFRRDLQVRVGRDVVFLFDERGVTALHGAPVAALAGHLDGRRDLAAIAAARPGGMTPGQVVDLVEQLVDAGLLVRVPPGTCPDEHDPAQAWWDASGGFRSAAEGAGRVTVTQVGPGSWAGTVEAALVSTGLAPVASGPVDLRVVLCTDYLDPALGEIDAAQRAAGSPWLLAKLDGMRLWIGPVFQPGSSGCWHCLAHRFWSHRRPEAVVLNTLGQDGPAPRPSSTLPCAAGAAAQLIALEAAKWTGGHRYDGQGTVWVLDTRDLQGSHHVLQTRPQCPACGDPRMLAERTARPVVLDPAPKVVGAGGGYRTSTPEEMLARHAHLVSPVTGIIKEVARDPFVPGFAQAFRSGTNLSRRLSGVAALRRSLRAENGGKGLNALDAEVGALCEAAERHAGTWQGDELRLRGSLRSLGERAVDPRSCMLFDERQHAAREYWNPRHSSFNHVPQPFDPDRELDWTPLWSLTEQRQRLLPTAMLYYGGPADPSMFADSNGCAAGSSREDAVLQGLLELIERDAVALWWYNRSRVPGVDITAFGDPRLVEQQEQHRGIGRELWALDLTSDLGVPVTAAVSRRLVGSDGAGERVLLGFGAHLDPALALRRAVSEVNQMLGVDRADPADSGDPDWTEWARHTVASDPYLLGDPTQPATTPADHRSPPREDIRDDVDALVARLEREGHEVLVLDQTRPDVRIPVVKVVVPGLRPFWARHAPGRLFDVPVRLGRTQHPTPYAELNPAPLFM